MNKLILTLSFSTLLSLGNVATAQVAGDQASAPHCPNKTYFCAGVSERGKFYCDSTQSISVKTCWDWGKVKCNLCINSQSELDTYFTTNCQGKSFYDTTTNATIQLTQIVPQHQCTNLYTSAPAPKE